MSKTIEYIGSDSSGMISITINGRRYSYKVDALLIPRWKKMINDGYGFKALDEIKKSCIWWRNDAIGKITFT